MIKDIFLGISAYFKHLPLVRRNSLLKYFLAPFLLGFFLLATIGTGAYSLSDNLGSMLVSWYPFETGANLINSASTWLSGILIFVFGIIVAKYVIIILASPFMSPMSEKIETSGSYTPVHPGQSISAVAGIWRGVRLASGNIFKELFFTVVLLILSLIFPFISPFTAVLIFIIQAYYAGAGNMDYTLERYFGVKESKRFIRANKGLAIGNGAVFIALLMLGLGFFIAPPLGTLAATPEVLKRLGNY